MRATARPIPLEAPVTIAARSGMGTVLSGGGGPEPTLSGVLRVPLTIMAVLGALLLGVWWLTDGRAEKPAGRRAPAPAGVAEIARRVEALRDLRFASIPRPVAVTPEQAR